jgi:formylglycine-generating enzyme required for sulfatase activity
LKGIGERDLSSTYSHVYLRELRQLIDRHFDLEGLRTLCFDLGVEYDSLLGEGKANKARELVTLMNRLERLDELVALCELERPKINWKNETSGLDNVPSSKPDASKSTDKKTTRLQSSPHIDSTIRANTNAVLYISEPTTEAGKLVVEPTPTSNPIYVSWLRQQIAQLFGLEELRVLCTDLAVRYDDLPGEGMTAKVGELIAYMQRRGRIEALLTECEHLKPKVYWGVRSTQRGGLVNTGEPEWMEIPAGGFWMGSEKGREWERPLHRLYLDTFWIARRLVTNDQYRLFVKASGYPNPAHWEDGAIQLGLEQHPVVRVGWHDALAYCGWLSHMTDKMITLPSEAQWEKAARGDSDQREYPWGDAFEAGRVNSKEAGIRRTNFVGSFPGGASPYGVLDLSGNAWEWTRSKWGANLEKPEFGYPYAPGDGREELDGNVPRIVRGGSWVDDKTRVRCAFRSWQGPNVKDVNLGFRVIALPFMADS